MYIRKPARQLNELIFALILNTFENCFVNLIKLTAHIFGYHLFLGIFWQLHVFVQRFTDHSEKETGLCEVKRTALAP